MSADAPSVTTVEHAGFTMTGVGAAEAVEAIKADELSKKQAKDVKDVKDGKEPEPEKSKGKAKVSEAASALGKLGGKAAAEKRAASEAEKEEAKPANTEKEAATETKEAATADDEDEGLDKHPRAKQRVEEATRKAKEARLEAQKERESRIRLEARLEALERGHRPATTEREPAREEASGDEPQLDTYLAKHPGAESKAISEWVADRDKWRDGQAEERNKAKQYAERVGKAETDLRDSIRKAMSSDAAFWEKVQPIAAELHATHNLDLNSQTPSGVNFLADELHLDPQNAPKILAYLADNRDDFEAIKGYRSPRQVTRAVALIEAHLKGATAGEPSSSERQVSKPAQESKAPPPVRPVTGAPSTASGADPAPRQGETFDDWNRRTGGRKR